MFVLLMNEGCCHISYLSGRSEHNKSIDIGNAELGVSESVSTSLTDMTAKDNHAATPENPYISIH